MTRPALLAISHGTSSPEGQAAVAALVGAVARRLPDTIVRLGHVDVQQPDVAASLDAIPTGTPVVIVPLLLSAGYHVRVDLIQQSAGRDGVTIAPALGPDERLVDALVSRLAGVAPAPDDTLVLAVAGSSDDRANEDCRVTARMLGARLGRPVGVGFLAAADPRLDVAVGSAGGRVVLANYLLAPGYFHDLAVTLSGGATVAPPLLGSDEPPASLVDLVVDRYNDTAALSD
ncbi:sirohydrochlorin chelatase [Microbacterium kyungheense]|uniref:Sirohydrochlorin ferrochelatase n=1 Tax=Microbacterium kyungheense TaxID=1263636 RepID=A0A543EEX6_9MICO|nr:CbiX/SirB N-terminal domain-containing protein [Microbacterium kyungheense]TQM20152.1 sirohydrochlorin ferrochelatase [Microbacterium kyungheense]